MEVQAKYERAVPLTTLDEFEGHVADAKRWLSKLRGHEQRAFDEFSVSRLNVLSARGAIVRLERFLDEPETVFPPLPDERAGASERFVNTMLTLADSWTSRGFNKCANEIGLALNDLQQPEARDGQEEG